MMGKGSRCTTEDASERVQRALKDVSDMIVYIIEQVMVLIWRFGN